MINPSSRSVVLVLLLWLAGLGAAVQFAKIAVPFAEFRALYPDAGAGIGWMLSIISLIGVFLGMMASILAARFGYKRTLIIGILLGAVMSFWQTFTPSFSFMILSRLIEGISHLIIVVVAPTLIAQLSSDRMRGMALTLWSTFFGVAFAVIAWVGLPFVDAYGLGQLFVAHGLYMLAIAASLAWAFQTFDIRLPRSETPLRLDTIAKWHWNAVRSPRISAPAWGWLFYTMTFVSLLAILPETLPANQRATLAGWLPLISIASALVLVPLLLTKFSAVRVVTVGFLLASGVLLLTFSGVSMSYIWIVLFAILGLIQGGSFAAVPQLNHNAQDQALANGFMAMMGNFGNTIGTPTLLMALNGFDISGMLILVTAIYAIGAFTHMLTGYRRKYI